MLTIWLTDLSNTYRVLARTGQWIVAIGVAWLGGVGVDAVATANSPGVRFDVPQWVEGFDVSATDSSHVDRLISIELPVSIIVDSLANPTIDQLVIEITPRGGSTMVVDYAPRTEMGSDYSGGIEVLRTDELARSLTLGIDAPYPPMSVSSLSGGLNQKNIASYKYNRVAPRHLIAASGTIRRGRGVYFKFRSTDQQIIEGDRLLQLTLRVPADWRGEWIDVLILGDRHPTGLSAGLSSLTGAPPKPVRVGAGRFLIAAYPNTDEHAQALARTLVDAESAMRTSLLGQQPYATGPHSLSQVLKRQVSNGIDWGENPRRGTAAERDWILHRALAGSLNPHVDSDFRALPAEVRAVCLGYLAARREFSEYTRGIKLIGTKDQTTTDGIATNPAAKRSSPIP